MVVSCAPSADGFERSLEQRRQALKLANAVRSERAALKRELKSGRVFVLDVVREPPGFCETMKLMDLLLATPKIGRTKATKLLQAARVSPSKTLGGLSDRQRGELAGLLDRGLGSRSRCGL